MFDLVRAQAVWDRVCACGGQCPALTVLHPCCVPARQSGVTPVLQILTLLRLLSRICR